MKLQHIADARKNIALGDPASVTFVNRRPQGRKFRCVPARCTGQINIAGRHGDDPFSYGCCTIVAPWLLWRFWAT